ncbi:hypothetical protein H4R21_004727, partial [Coemansia helicoidea]
MLRARPVAPRMALRVGAVAATARRAYHEDVAYGYRVPKNMEYPDYSPEQLRNRQQNAKLVCLVNAYRSMGHRATDLDPLKLQTRQAIPELDPARHGIADPDESFDVDGILGIAGRDGSTTATAGEICAALKDIYCGHVAFEFEHIPDAAERRWFADHVESTSSAGGPDAGKQRRFHELLARSEVFDNFMQKKFGQ